jgi:acyl-CoA synthetase (AMP-forming)/AMP-acid ligase II
MNMTTIPTDATLVSALAARTARDPDGPALVLFAEDGARATIGAAVLYEDARMRAAGLSALGVGAGDVVLLALGHGSELVTTFLGTLLAGIVPAILSPPGPRADAEAYAARMKLLAERSRARMVVASPELRPQLEAALGATCRAVSVDTLAGDARAASRPTAPDDLALLQYTSGTTGLQRVVAHTHRAMLTLIREKVERIGLTQKDVVVSWLPLYHDMGLLSGLLLPLLNGFTTVLISPFHWAREPGILLRAVHDYRGSVTWMPNAGLTHCARAIRQSELDGLDLSSWRLVISGGEPVRPETLRAFAERFAPYGLRPTAVQAGYGMAETVEGLATTATPEDRPVPMDWVRRHDLQADRRAVPASPDEPGAVGLVSCGTPYPSVEVRIAAADGRPLPERHVGEVVTRGPHIFTRGYYLHPELTAATRRDGWLLTGDLGYIADGELYVCGRQKDLIILGGRNVHPEDIETAANAIPGLGPGRAVAFAVDDERTGSDRAVLVCELPAGADELAIRREARRRVAHELDVNLGEVRVVPRGWIVKTSSGKLARSDNRAKYLGERAAER